MTELALTRIFSVVMYYHFAFLAISIALFGLSASGVFAYVARRRLDRVSDRRAAGDRSRSIYAASHDRRAVLAGAAARRPELLADESRADADDLRAGRAAVLHRRPRRHARDLAAVGADQRRLRRRSDRRRRRLPGPDPAARPARRARRRADRRRAVARRGRAVRAAAPARARVAGVGAVRPRSSRSPASSPASPASTSSTPRATRATACCSASGIRSRASASTSATHGDWSLSPTYNGPLPDTRFMDIDSAASTPILGVTPDLSNAQYLRYELTALAYHLKERDWADCGSAHRRLTPGSIPARRLHRAGHRPRRRTRSRRRRWCSAPRASTASRSIRSSPTT